MKVRSNNLCIHMILCNKITKESIGNIHADNLCNFRKTVCLLLFLIMVNNLRNIIILIFLSVLFFHLSPSFFITILTALIWFLLFFIIWFIFYVINSKAFTIKKEFLIKSKLNKFNFLYTRKITIKKLLMWILGKNISNKINFQIYSINTYFWFILWITNAWLSAICIKIIVFLVLL